MKKEKIILSFIAALIGIVVALIAFYFYQSTKKIDPSEIKQIVIENPTPTPASNLFLNITQPKDESVVDKRIITITGQTIPNAKIVIVTQSDEVAAIAASNGNFSTEVTLEDNENIIEVTAVAENGETSKAKLTVIYSEESF